MGKTTRWFRSLLGSKKSSESNPLATEVDAKLAKGKKTKWGLIKSVNHNERGNKDFQEPSSSPYIETLDANKHAIAVAAATAAVAEAAIAAAQAAAQVVRLTRGSRLVGSYTSSSSDGRRESAAIRIQSAFRAYLARRALRALKGLVKLQALVRGHIVRKQSAHMLRRMQAMARIQARACANRALSSESTHLGFKSSQFRRHGTAALKGYDLQQCPQGAKYDRPNPKRFVSKSTDCKISAGRPKFAHNLLDRWMEEYTETKYQGSSLKNERADDEENDKILEIDTWKPCLKSKQGEKSVRVSRNFSSWREIGEGCTTVDPMSADSSEFNKLKSSAEVSYLNSLKFGPEWIIDNSPSACSASSRPGSSSRRGPFTPTRSECSKSLFGDYPGYPNYMANTESSRAKVRSQSAPRQRIQLEKHGMNRSFIHSLWDADTNSEKGFAVHSNFQYKAYAGSGRPNSLGTSTHAISTSSLPAYGSSR